MGSICCPLKQRLFSVLTLLVHLGYLAYDFYIKVFIILIN